jgi:nucleoid-associated protein YgaU
MQFCGSAQGPLCKWRRTIFCGAFFLFFSTTIAHGQDVAEAARQEQARKTAEAKTPRHVYTEEDLKQKKILTPDDQALVEARKKQMEPAPAQVDAEQLPSNQGQQTESLGEIARRYRQEKAGREAELATKKKIAPFPYELPAGVLADPKPAVAPTVGSALPLDSRARVRTAAPAGAHASPAASGVPARISPFEPRRLAVPHSAPLVREPAVRPVAPAAPAPVALVASPRTSREASAATVNPLPVTELSGFDRVRVQSGDSWWKLAKRYLGTGARWQELRSANAEAVGPPELLRLGSVVLVPERSSSSGKLAEQNLIVHKGDTLWSLARAHLGSGSAWKCLANANPQILEYDHMAIGTSLRLPDSETLESCRIGRAEKLQN